MASVIDLNLKPEPKTLRHFGWIALVGFSFVAALAWYEKLIFSFGLGDARPIVAGGFAALAGISAFFSLVYPKANWPIYVGLAILTFPIGFVLSYLIMGTLFYLIITPVPLGFRPRWESRQYSNAHPCGHPLGQHPHHHLNRHRQRRSDCYRYGHHHRPPAAHRQCGTR